MHVANIEESKVVKTVAACATVHKLDRTAKLPMFDISIAPAREESKRSDGKRSKSKKVVVLEESKQCVSKVFGSIDAKPLV